MTDFIEALIAGGVVTLKGARLVEAELAESGAKHAKVDLARLREILQLVRLVIGPYSEEEKAEAKAELDELAALTGNPPAEGESMVERAARGALMKARAAGELQGEGAKPEPPPTETIPPPAPETPPPAVPQAKPKAEVLPVTDKATGRTVMVQLSEGALVEMIRREGDKWVIYSEDGSKKLGEYDSEAEARKRLAEIEMFKAKGKLAESDSCLIEAIEPTGKIIDVLVIKAGTSMNGKRYRSAVLREAVTSGVFEGARSFASEGTDHYGARGVKALCGWWDNARYAEKVSLPNGRVVEGVAAHYHPTDRALRETLVEAIRGGRPDLIGFSIFGDGPLTPVRENGRTIQDVGRIESVDSIDPVMHPAAGGQALRLVASMETPVENLTPETPDVAKLVEAAVAPIRTAQLVEATLAEYPDLAPVAKARIRKLTEGQALTPESVKALIQAEAEYVAVLAVPPKPEGTGKLRIEAGQDQRAKLVESISDVLDGKTHSLRKVYVDLTGDESMTGKVQETGRLVESRLAESAIISTTFAYCTAEAMHKRLLAEYNKPGLDNWKKIVSTISTANDFRTQKLVLMGGYGDLSTVAEAGPYLTIAEPGEDSITFPALSKKGGLEDLTLEAVANDDVRLFRRIPTSLARAAKRTLYKGVWSVLTTNANFPDVAGNVPLFNAAHGGNLGATALSSAALSAARLVMLKQAELTSAEPIGIAPKFLIVPPDLEETAWVILNTTKIVGNAENDLSFVNNMGLEVIRVDHWTDVTNWYLAADPNLYDMLEVAFFQGREEPELFLQDQPLLGENFSNDRLTYKIRHIWAVGVADYRPFFRASVAG